MRWLVLFFLFAVSCNASEIVYLKNGDRVTGAVERLDSGKILVKTDLFGEIKIDLAQVSRVESDKNFVVASAAHSYSATELALTDTNANVSLASSGSASVPREHLQQVYSAAYKPAHSDTALWSDWSSAIDAGMSTARGNTSSFNMNFGFKAARVTDHDRLGLNLTSIYSQNSTTGQTVTSANAIHAGSRYDLNLGDRSFTFALANFDTDQLQDLDLRAVLGGGLGYRLLQGQHAAFDVFSGASFNQELFSSQPIRRTGEFITGQEFRLQATSRTELTQRVMFFPNFTQTGEYRITFDSGAIVKLNSWLGWQTSLTDAYLSNPPAEARNNDMLITTGIRLTLGRERTFKPKLKVPAFTE